MERRTAIGIALAVAVALCAFALAFVCALLPPQSDVGDEGKDFGYVYSGAKSASVEFTAGSMPEDSLLLFGSSELSTPPSLVSQVPAVVFGMHSCGVNLTYIGEAYDQSLWQAIAAGAYARRVGSGKVVIIVSPSWFFDGGLDNSLFETRFSYSLYRGFMGNPDLSDELKARVRARVEEQGIDAAVARAAAAVSSSGSLSGSGDAAGSDGSDGLDSSGSSSVLDSWGGVVGPVALVNDAVFAAMDDLKLRADLREVRSKGFAHETGGSAVPKFDVLREQALAEAKEKSTNNDWGFDDASFLANGGDDLDAIADKLAGETFTDTPEYGDFELFLEVCDEAGFEPLVVLPPLSGDFYDWVGVGASARQSCYERIRAIADDHGAALADFSDKEYERYFLHDMVHFGWTGWVDAEQAVYEFAKGE